MSILLDIKIVDLTTTENKEFIKILWTALNPDGVTARTRDILNNPIIKPFYTKWGKPDDIVFAAIKNDKMIGAIWSRIKESVTRDY